MLSISSCSCNVLSSASLLAFSSAILLASACLANSASSSSIRERFSSLDT